MVPEIEGVIRECEEDRSLWKRVAGVTGRRIWIRFCCNSSQVRRVLVQQMPRGGIVEDMASDAKAIPVELSLVIDKCKQSEELRQRVEAFATGKFDIIFIFSGGALRDEIVQEVS